MNLTLLIDGNWLAISRMSIFANQFKKSNPDIIKSSAAEDFKILLARSINVILNRFIDIDNIILISDGGSWRKSLAIPKCLETTYKGNRGDDMGELDFDIIFKSFNEFISHCKDIGITCCNGVNCEGDDWIWYWSRKLNSEGINVMIWSSDNDLKQLVQKGNNGSVTMWYNDKNGLFLHEALNEKLSDIDFFLQGDSINPIIKNMIHLLKIEPHYINPENIILNKIFCGDSSDNIKSVARYIKNGRTYNFSNKDFQNLIKELNINNLNKLFENYEFIANYIINQKKFKPYKINSEDVYEMLVYNTKLVWLNESNIPDIIIHQMNTSEYKKFNINEIRNNYKILLEDEEDVKNLFESL